MIKTVNSILPPSKWQTMIGLVLLFWLSGSMLLDFVIMPELYVSGMMSQPGFAAAGYSIFWLFNRIELVCAALILTGLLVLHQRQKSPSLGGWSIWLAVGLFAIALVDTYALTPEMSALGLQLDLFQNSLSTATSQMQLMQWGYLSLEVCKLLFAATLVANAPQGARPLPEHNSPI